jgi:DNA-binding GntR family transcriptional regulator
LRTNRTTQKPRRETRARESAVTDEDIAERIVNAICNQQLPPGAKLGESQLGAVFGVSRTRIRQVLFRLATAKVITISLNRGACVARPTPQEAREVFGARRVIESAQIAQLAKAATPFQLARLREHLGAENAARARGDYRALLRLTGVFHALIADMAGNTVIAEMLRALVARSSLIIALYPSSSPASCPPDEHGALLDAVSRRDAARATTLMRRHLEHVERALDIDGPAPRQIDLKAVFNDLRTRV